MIDICLLYSTEVSPLFVKPTALVTSTGWFGYTFNISASFSVANPPEKVYS